MTRRGGPNVKYIAIVVICLLCFYGFYSFHNLYTRLKNAEEKTTRLGQQHDSVSAQLQVVYEHKNRLEKSLQQEKTDHQRTKDEMKESYAESEEKYQNEKNELMGRIDSINQENKMLQMKVDDQEQENTRLKEEVSNLQHDAEKRDTQHNEEYLQFKQEKEFEVARLKDEVSNIARKRDDLQYQLDSAVKGQQLHQRQFQQQELYARQLQDEIQNLKGRLQPQAQAQGLGQQQQQYAQQNNYAGQQPLHQNNMLNQGQVQYQPQQQQQLLQGQQAGIQNNLQQQNVGQFNQNQQQLGGLNAAGVGVDTLHNVNAGVQNVQNAEHAEPQGDSMQINKPDEKKSYFEPKLPDNNLEHNLAAEAKQLEENQLDGGKVVQEQVIPPKFQDNVENMENRYGERRANVLDNNHLGNRYREHPIDANIDQVQDRYREKRSEDADEEDEDNNLNDNYDSDGYQKVGNKYREDVDNYAALNDENGDDNINRMQLQGKEPKLIDHGGINGMNPMERNAINAPDGIEVNHPNDPFRRINQGQQMHQIDSNIQQDAFVGLKYNADKALEDDVALQHNPGALGANLDNAAERNDFDVDPVGQYNMERMDVDQKDQAVDRPPLIGQGLQGGLPQRADGAIFHGNEHNQEVAPDGFGHHEQ